MNNMIQSSRSISLSSLQKENKIAIEADNSTKRLGRRIEMKKVALIRSAAHSNFWNYKADYS